MTAPFIRSAGGKREQAPTILSLMPDASAFDVYVEPFLGGGAMFYALHDDGRLKDKLVVLGDGNPDLINLYAAVRDDPSTLTRNAGLLIGSAMNDPETVYRSEQNLWNADPANRTPARQLYLRHACWNGLWRVSKDGNFNTPWRRLTPAKLDVEKFFAAHNALQGVELLDWDFQDYEDRDDFYIGARTLVYLDPPYLGNDGAFVGYRAEGWGLANLEALVGLAAEWTNRGAYVVLSHSDTPELQKVLTERWPTAKPHPIEARRSINSDGKKRGPVPEVIVVGKPAVDTLHVPLHALGNHAEVARA